MKLSKFKYKLPPELIALHPTPNRDEARLMVLDRKTGKIEHKVFKDVIDYFDEKDVFVFNDSKVFPARLYGNKEKTGAEIEVYPNTVKTAANGGSRRVYACLFSQYP